MLLHGRGWRVQRVDYECSCNSQLKISSNNLAKPSCPLIKLSKKVLACVNVKSRNRFALSVNKMLESSSTGTKVVAATVQFTAV